MREGSFAMPCQVRCFHFAGPALSRRGIVRGGMLLCAGVSRCFFTSPCEASPFPPSYRRLSGTAELALSSIWSWSRWLGAECKGQFTMQINIRVFLWQFGVPQPHPMCNQQCHCPKPCSQPDRGFVFSWPTSSAVEASDALDAVRACPRTITCFAL